MKIRRFRPDTTRSVTEPGRHSMFLAEDGTGVSNQTLEIVEMARDL